MKTRKAGVLIAAVMLLGACGGNGGSSASPGDYTVWFCEDGSAVVTAVSDNLWKFDHSSGWSSTSEWDEMMIDAANFDCNDRVSSAEPKVASNAATLSWDCTDGAELQVAVSANSPASDGSEILAYQFDDGPLAEVFGSSDEYSALIFDHCTG